MKLGYEFSYPDLESALRHLLGKPEKVAVECIIRSMKVLVTGANGYIGKRLINYLLSAGHTVIALIRDKRRFDYKRYQQFINPESKQLQVIQGDLTDLSSCEEIPQDIVAAYYLVHSMSATKEKRFL